MGLATSVRTFPVLSYCRCSRDSEFRGGAVQLVQRIPAGSASGRSVQHERGIADSRSAAASGLDADTQREPHGAARALECTHLEERVHTDLLAARIHSYELAARMQAAIPEAMDFSSEPKHVQDLYGLDRTECRETARNCLAARRLIERGVERCSCGLGDGVSWMLTGTLPAMVTKAIPVRRCELIVRCRTHSGSPSASSAGFNDCDDHH